MEIFFSIDQIPVIINNLSSTREEALGQNRGDLKLGFCGECGHVYNTAYDPGLLDYSGDYDNSLHFSAVFRQWAKSLVTELIESNDLRHKPLIEVGCGKADFLRMLCSEGGNVGIGYDPSIEDVDWLDVGKLGGRVKLIRGIFTSENADVEGQMIFCRHVLEHIAAPLQFVRELRDSRSKLPSHKVYFEVPNVLYTLRDKGIWDLIYEHCSYFSPMSLARILQESGYHVGLCEEVYGKQFLSIQAEYRIGSIPRDSEHPDTSEIQQLVEAFGKDFQSKLVYWQSRLFAYQAEEKKVVVWGAGSKGITFLNMLAVDSNIEYVVDLNPSKHGKYVAGTGQQIVLPEFMSSYVPDRVIIMNPNYLEEITATLAAMNLNPEIEVA
jgi:hypothetical protein